MPSDHVHERSEQDTRWVPSDLARYRCSHCSMGQVATWWNVYEAAIAEIEANGLPDHEQRVGVVLEEIWLSRARKDSPSQALAGIFIAAYLAAPLEKEE